MEVVTTTPSSDSEATQSDGATGESGQAFTCTVYAADPVERHTKRPLGHVTIRPVLLAPGQVAAVRTPDGLLRLMRIYYFREGEGGEHVRLESLELGRPALRYPLGEVTIVGAVICVCGVDEECECATVL